MFGKKTGQTEKEMKRILKLLCFVGSADGEDRMMLSLLPEKGTYLDVGCYRPVKGSNTLLLYLSGWRGTCIDINKIRRFRLFRPRDKFVQATVTDISEYKDYNLLDIDVDGIDLDILKTMKFYPEWILAETCMPSQQGIPAYLESLGYKVIGMTSRNKLFRRESK